MLTIKPSKIFISSANVDMRKSIDGLACIVEQSFKLNPLSDMMFVFHNRHCDKVKILYWDGNGNGYKVEINHETKQVTLNEW